MNRAALIAALVFLVASPGSAAIHLIHGDDDDFNGLLPGGPGTVVPAGALDSLPVFSGTITDSNGDFQVQGNVSTLKLVYNFPVDLTGIANIVSATVELRAASIGISGAFAADGFGLADVSFGGNSLGKLNSPLVGSPEVIQNFSFNVAPFLTAGVDNGNIQFVIDGTTAGIAGTDNQDGIKVEFARLWVMDIPEPASFAVWSVLGTIGLIISRRRANS